MKTRKMHQLLWVLGACLVILMAFGCGGGGGGGDTTPPPGGGGNPPPPPPPPPPTPFSVEFASLQFRNHEDAANNVYFGLVGLVSSSGAVVDTDVVDIEVTDAAGTAMVPTEDDFYTVSFYEYDCQGGTCTESGPATHTGVWAKFDPLLADTYTVTVNMDNGQTLTASNDYPGMVDIPCILADSMNSWRDNGDLVLTWKLRQAETNWGEIDMMLIDIVDTAGANVLQVKVDATEDTVTLPGTLIDTIEAWSGTTVASWQIQTRAYDDNSMNFARGYSALKALNNDPAPYALDFVFLQYRAFEDVNNNTDFGLVSITDNGSPIADVNVTGLAVKDPSGADITINNQGFFDANFIWYDCLGGGCQPGVAEISRGFWLNLASMAAGVHTVVAEMDNNQVLTAGIDYPGQTVLPLIESGDMDSEWMGGDLVFSWTNALAGTEVNQIMVVVFDSAGKDVLYARLDATATTLTLPAALIADAMAQGDGTIATWQIQTRAVAAGGNNYARGYSDTIAINDPPPYKLEYAALQYRVFEDPLDNKTSGFAGISKNGGLIADGDVTSGTITTNGGTLFVSILANGYYWDELYNYDCIGGTCTMPTDPITDSGIWFDVADQLANDYHLSLTMENLQVLETDFVGYPGTVPVPLVVSADMTAEWVGTDSGDLRLAWVNPPPSAGWDLVTQIRVLIKGAGGTVVIQVKLDKVEEIIIPKELVEDAVALGGGALQSWRIQTRAYDTSGLNYARGYSDEVNLPAPPP